MGALRARTARWPAVALLAAVLTVLGLLAGCGGGDPEEEPDVPARKGDCRSNPEVC